MKLERKTMKAWVLDEPERLIMKELPVPEPKPNEVLIKIDAACICNGSDPGIYRGHEAYTTPMVFGHEAGGRIVEAGANVSGFAVGDRVCWWCEAGAFAEYQAVSPDRVSMFPLPENVTIEESPVMELVIASCRSIMKEQALAYGKSLLICGLGPSGLVLTQYARIMGFERIVGLDLYESRRELALSLGADAVYDSAEVARGGVPELENMDAAVFMMGDDVLPGEPMATAVLRRLRYGGLVISYGHPEHGMRFSPYVFQSRDLTMISPEGRHEVIREKGKRIMQAVRSGEIKISPIITHVIPFEGFLAAFDHLLVRPQDQIKVILKVNEEV